MNWDKLLDNKNADSQILLSNDIILTIFRNILPNKYVTCDEKDPFWMDENIKLKTKAKSKLYQVYVKKDRQETEFCALEESVRNLNDLILRTKTSYYDNLGKLNPFLTNVPILYPLKIPENLWFSGVFRGYK